MIRKFLQLSIIPLSVLVLTSCHAYHKISYIDKVEQHDTLWAKNKPVYHLQPKDNLYIRILSTNQEVNTLYNPLMSGTSGGGMNMTGGSMYLYGYQVSDSGTIRMPILGVLKVAGLSIEETEKLVQARTDLFLHDALAIVKLAEFKVTFIGEMNASVSYQGDQLNILDAISKAGGLPYSSKRSHLVIIRQEEKGTRSFVVDITDPNLLASTSYYLQPNDIVYVKPNFLKAYRVTIGDYLMIAGTLTTAVTTLLLLTKL